MESVFATKDRNFFPVPVPLKTYSPSTVAKPAAFNNDNGKAERSSNPGPISDVSVWDVLPEGEVSGESCVPSSRLEESWPTRSESCGGVRGRDECGPPRAVVGVAWGETSRCGVDEELKEKRKLKREGSTLARYVERFRSAPPTSRDSREMPNQQFWWSQASRSKETGTHPLILPPDFSAFASTTSHDKSQSFTDASPQVSSEDSQAQDLLGWSSEVLRLVGSPPALKFLNSVVQPLAQASPGGGVGQPRLVDSQQQRDRVPPSGDILTRWRMRRRLEQAREEAALWTRRESCLCHNVHDLTNPRCRLSPICSAERHGLVCASCGGAAGSNRSLSDGGVGVKPGKDTGLRCTGLERTRGFEAAVSEVNIPSCRGHSCRRQVHQVDVGMEKDGHFSSSLPEGKCTRELQLVGGGRPPCSGGSQSVLCVCEAGRPPCSGGSQSVLCVCEAGRPPCSGGSQSVLCVCEAGRPPCSGGSQSVLCVCEAGRSPCSGGSQSVLCVCEAGRPPCSGGSQSVLCVCEAGRSPCSGGSQSVLCVCEAGRPPCSGGSQSVLCVCEAGRPPCSGGSQSVLCVDRAASVERELANAQMLGSSAEHIQTLCDLHEGSCDLHEGSCDVHTEGSCDLHEGSCDHTERTCDLCTYDCKVRDSQTCTVDQPPSLLSQPPLPAMPHALGQLPPAVEEGERKTLVNQQETTSDATVERRRPYPCHGGLALRDLTPSEEEVDQFTLTFSEEDSSLLATSLKHPHIHALPNSSTPVPQERSNPNCSSHCWVPTDGTCRIPVQPLQKKITPESLATTSVWCCEDDELLKLLMTKAKFFEAQIRDINCLLMVLQHEEPKMEHSDHMTLP